MTNEQIETVKTVVDAASVSAVVAIVFQWLPPVAAFVTIIWTLIRIYETETVQTLIKKWRKKR